MIKIIFLDVDGTLTDGGIYLSNSGEEMKKFNVRDGFGIQEWQRIGNLAAIITGKSSAIVAKRASDLKIKHVYQGVKDKFTVAEQILKQENLTWDEAAAIGDDTNDIRLLRAVGISFRPKDALHSVPAKFTLTKKGGHGAVREMIEMLVDANGQREAWDAKWL